MIRKNDSNKNRIKIHTLMVSPKIGRQTKQDSRERSWPVKKGEMHVVIMEEKTKEINKTQTISAQYAKLMVSQKSI